MLLNYQSLHNCSPDVNASTQAFSHFDTASDKCWDGGLAHRMRLSHQFDVHGVFLSAAC